MYISFRGKAGDLSYYRLDNVAYSDYMQLINASSIGSHYSKSFRGKYPTTKIDASDIPGRIETISIPSYKTMISDDWDF